MCAVSVEVITIGATPTISNRQYTHTHIQTPRTRTSTAKPRACRARVCVCVCVMVAMLTASRSSKSPSMDSKTKFNRSAIGSIGARACPEAKNDDIHLRTLATARYVCASCPPLSRTLCGFEFELSETGKRSARCPCSATISHWQTHQSINNKALTSSGDDSIDSEVPPIWLLCMGLCEKNAERRAGS